MPSNGSGLGPDFAERPHDAAFRRRETAGGHGRRAGPRKRPSSWPTNRPPTWRQRAAERLRSLLLEPTQAQSVLIVDHRLDGLIDRVDRVAVMGPRRPR